MRKTFFAEKNKKDQSNSSEKKKRKKNIFQDHTKSKLKINLAPICKQQLSEIKVHKKKYPQLKQKSDRSDPQNKKQISLQQIIITHTQSKQNINDDRKAKRSDKFIIRKQIQNPSSRSNNISSNSPSSVEEEGMTKQEKYKIQLESVLRKSQTLAKLQQTMLLSKANLDDEINKDQIGQEINGQQQFNQTLDGKKIQGQKIKWKTGNFLGRGSFGHVQRGINLANGHIIAVKRIMLQFPTKQQQQQLRLLQQQISILQTTIHPNIVKYIDHQRLNGYLNIYMQNMNGNLLELIKKFGPLQNTVIKKYLKQILNALIYLHQEKKIIHKDLKCSNILMSSKGVLKLTDFGSSKTFQGTQILQKQSLKRTLRGSILWMAPQVMQQNNYGRKSDIWSLGCTIIQLVTSKVISYNQPPWSQYSFQNQISALLKIGSTKQLPYIPDTLDPNLTNLIHCCLKRNPTQRLKAIQLIKHPFFN